jgi:glycosyltransferase involved in cell wall biosynthesis
MNPTVSVIIPNYNRESFLVETLDSLSAQLYEDWEAIVVDDGSTDRSVARANSIRDCDKRITVIAEHNEPKGASACRNMGIKRSKGAYLIENTASRTG